MDQQHIHETQDIGIDDFQAQAGVQNTPDYKELDHPEPKMPEIDSPDDDSTSDSSEYMLDDYNMPYEFAGRSILKTSDRIFDDLRNDVLFLINGEEGILQRSTMEYYQDLSSKINTEGQPKYQLFQFDPKGKLLRPFTRNKLVYSEQSISTFDGLIAPVLSNGLVDTDFTSLKLFHYRIKIKSHDYLINKKSKLYLFNDDELNSDDQKSMIVNRESLLFSFQSINDIPGDNEFKTKNLETALPEIIDSCNYICNETNTIIRIEIYPTVLKLKDLETFTLTEINTRMVTYNSMGGEEFDKVISPSTSLRKFYNALSDPFKSTESGLKRHIDLESTHLGVYVDVDLLKKKFLFKSSVFDCREQLQPQYFQDWGNYSSIIKDYYQRALLEVQYLMSLFEVTERSKLKMNIDNVFQLINDLDSKDQRHHWTNWTANHYYIPDMILLSVSPYYSVETISELFYFFANDSTNLPIYFQALINISKVIQNYQLNELVVSFRRKGLVSFNELQNAFNAIGLNHISPSIERMSACDPLEIIEAYEMQIAVASTVQEKKSLRSNLIAISSYKHDNKIRLKIFTELFFDIDEAYRLLNVTFDKEDDWILTMYTSNLNENDMSRASDYARALLTIGDKRRSLGIMNFIWENLNQYLPINLTTETAYETLGVLRTADDETIIRVFQNRASTDLNVEYRSLWVSLKVIAEDKKSDLIEAFIKTGIINSSLLAVERTPAGIENIGNTCYLNSLLQYYFVIKPFRDYILNFEKSFDIEEFENNPIFQTRRIGGRNVGLNETQRSYQFVHKLKELYYAMIHDDSRCVIPKRELAFLAFSPIEQVVNITTTSTKGSSNEDPIELDSSTEINDNENSVMNPIDLTLSEPPEDIKEGADNSDDMEIQHEDDIELISSDEQDKDRENAYNCDIDSDIVMIEKEAVENVLPPVDSAELLPVENTSKPKSDIKVEISDEDYQFAIEQSGQQDVTECIQNVLAQTETAMDPDVLDKVDDEQIDIVKELFFGKTKQTLTKIDLETMQEIPNADKRTKFERFLNLIVSLEDHPKNMYDALDGYFSSDLLELDNESVKRSLTISELPKILQIQIQRVQYDRQLFIPVKNTTQLPFDSTIYMDRFMETEDPEMLDKREKSFQWRVKLGELKTRLEYLSTRGPNGMTIKDSLISTKNFLLSQQFKSYDLPADSNTMEVLNDQISKLDTEIMDLKEQIAELEDRLLHQFDEFKKIGYSVFAAFIHRGSATYGHYWIYIRDPKNNVWRVYNDETVSEISPELVFDFSDTNKATPYYLVFVKDDMIDEIEPLRREIIRNAVESEVILGQEIDDPLTELRSSEVETLD